MDEVTINIQGAGLSFNGKTDFFKAGQIITFLNAPQNSSQTTGAMTTISSPQRVMLNGESRKSLREAILQSGAKTNAQKIAVLADYLLQDGGKATFNAGEIKPLFARAGEPVPKNFRRDMLQAIHDCYVFPSSTQSGEYELSEKVPGLIINGFGSETDRGPRRTGGGVRSASRAKKEIDSKLQEIDITTHMDGYVAFHDLPTKGQKILWILLYAKNHGVDAMNTSEVSFLADKLNENISTSLFPGLNEGNKKRGYVSMKGDKYKILQSGMEVLSLSKK